MNFLFQVTIILAVGASLTFASVILADDNIYWETNSRQCQRGDFGKNFINNQGDHCECIRRFSDLSECKRHYKAPTRKPKKTTTTTGSPTTTTIIPTTQSTTKASSSSTTSTAPPSVSTASSTAVSKAAVYAYWPKRATIGTRCSTPT